MEESQRGLLRDKLEAWERAAGAGVTSCDALNAESAFGELQLARPLHAYGFLPTLQRRLAVLRELGAAVAEEHRCELLITPGIPLLFNSHFRICVPVRTRYDTTE